MPDENRAFYKPTSLFPFSIFSPNGKITDLGVCWNSIFIFLGLFKYYSLMSQVVKSNYIFFLCVMFCFSRIELPIFFHLHSFPSICHEFFTNSPTHLKSSSQTFLTFDTSGNPAVTFLWHPVTGWGVLRQPFVLLPLSTLALLMAWDRLLALIAGASFCASSVLNLPIPGSLWLWATRLSGSTPSFSWSTFSSSFLRKGMCEVNFLNPCSSGESLSCFHM